MSILRIALGIVLSMAVLTNADSYSDLSKEFDAAVKVFMDEYRAADESARKALLDDAAREPRHRFTPRFLAAAQKRRGSADAVPYWTWLLENGSIVDRAAGDEAASRLLHDHIKDKNLVVALKAFRRAAGVRGPEATRRDLTEVISRSPYAEVRAEALFQRGLLERQDGDEARAREDLSRAAAEAPDSDAATHATEMLHALAPLTSGMPAPALDARDFHGKRIRLAALRGRVVLVDFWGMWCGPCVAQLPRIRALSERYGKRGLTIVGVNSDRDAAAVSAFAAKNNVNWSNVKDGGTTGPIAAKWRVDTWPTTFLIDAAGTIRGRDLPFEELESAIVRLLDERPAHR